MSSAKRIDDDKFIAFCFRWRFQTTKEEEKPKAFNTKALNPNGNFCWFSSGGIFANSFHLLNKFLRFCKWKLHCMIDNRHIISHKSKLYFLFHFKFFVAIVKHQVISLSVSALRNEWTKKKNTLNEEAKENNEAKSEWRLKLSAQRSLIELLAYLGSRAMHFMVTRSVYSTMVIDAWIKCRHAPLFRLCVWHNLNTTNVLLSRDTVRVGRRKRDEHPNICVVLSVEAIRTQHNTNRRKNRMNAIN